MTALDYEHFADLLRARAPGFDRIYDAHLRDYDEALPHVLLGDLVRFLSEEVRIHGDGSKALSGAMALLESAMGSADPKLRELVAGSFLENLDPGSEAFPAISRLLGPRLWEQYQKR